MMTNITLFEAPVKNEFYRYILNGNTNNYNKFGNSASISDININTITKYIVNNLSHFVINSNNYFFCNSNNKINAYTNTGVLYYTTEEEFPDIENMIINDRNNIYIKYDNNRLACLSISADKLTVEWSIQNNNFGSYLTLDKNYIYINDKKQETLIYIIDSNLIYGDYIIKTISINDFESNPNIDVSDHIVKMDLFTDETAYNILANDKYTIITSNLYIIYNTIYFARHNKLYRMNQETIDGSFAVFDSDDINIVKIDKYYDDYLYIMTDDNRVVIIKLDEDSEDIGSIIYSYNDSLNKLSHPLLDIVANTKDKYLYFIYSDVIEKNQLSLLVDDNGIMGGQCYKFDGGGSYIEFNSMPMFNNDFGVSISFKPTKVNNNKSILFGGCDNYKWSSICWSNYLNIFCSIANNDNVTSIMPDDGSDNWYTSNIRTLPVSSWCSICWDNVHNLFYTISNDNKFAYSSDGLEWDLLYNIPNDYKWNKVYFADYINNIYILQKDSNKLLYSMDVSGTWKNITLPIVSDWKDIAYKNSDKTLILVNGSNIIYNIKSHNIFTNIVVGDETHKWSNVIYSKDNELFILIGKNTNKIAYSTNGIIWNIKTLPYTDSWISIVYDPYILNKYLLFSEYNDSYLISDDLIDWKVITELDCYFNFKDATVSDSRVCVLFGDTDLTFYPTGGEDVVINGKHFKTHKNVFNRNITKSTFQLYFNDYDNFLYVQYGNYKFKCYFKLDSSKLNEWFIISAIINNNNVKVYSNDKLISNFNIVDDLSIYNYSSNVDDKIRFIYYGNNEYYNIYTFRIGNSTFNNNDNKNLYGYVNDLILYNYSITEKEIDDNSKIKVLHCKFDYDSNQKVYNNIVNDISYYKHHLTGNVGYSSIESALKFDSSKKLSIANNYKFNNDKFTLSFWYKDDITLGSKIIISNYDNLDLFMMLMASQFKPESNLRIKLIHNNYAYNEFNVILYKDNWILNANDNYYYYTIENSNIHKDNIIDILPNIKMTNFEYNILTESGIEGYSQDEGILIVRCHITVPVIDIPIRIITRPWDEDTISLHNIKLLADNWNNNLYTIELDDIKSTDTIEILMADSIHYKKYNAIVGADIRGYEQSDGYITIKAHSIVPNINTNIKLLINKSQSNITNMILDRNYWEGEELPVNYTLNLEDSNDNFINILFDDDSTTEEINTIKTAGLRDAGVHGTESSGWVIAYMPTEENINAYSLYFVMLDTNKNVVKFKLTKDEHNYNDWNNYVISYNDGIFNTYVNGIPQRVENQKNYISNNNIVIGANVNLINDIDVGVLSGEYYMKDFRIYHQILNNNYILELYNRGNILNSNGTLYTTSIEENNDIVDISKEGIKVNTITEMTDTDPDNIYNKEDLLINLNHGDNENEVLLKYEICEIL